MGLDLAFNRKAAVAAGLVLITEMRDPDGATNTNNDADSRAWCAEVVTYVTVPELGVLIEDDGYEDDIIVRADKWGRVYAPLTAFLNQHLIPWEEF